MSLFRRGAESDDPGAIVEAARYNSAVVVCVGSWATNRIEGVGEVVLSLLARGRGCRRSETYSIALVLGYFCDESHLRLFLEPVLEW